MIVRNVAIILLAATARSTRQYGNVHDGAHVSRSVSYADSGIIVPFHLDDEKTGAILISATVDGRSGTFLVDMGTPIIGLCDQFVRVNTTGGLDTIQAGTPSSTQLATGYTAHTLQIGPMRQPLDAHDVGAPMPYSSNAVVTNDGRVPIVAPALTVMDFQFTCAVTQGLCDVCVFRTMNDVAGKDLSWFWREWFYETPGFDQSIDSVTQTTRSGKTTVRVVYGNRARGVFPLRIHFVFVDGTTQDVTHPVDVWRVNSTRYVTTYTFAAPVKEITVDVDHQLIDADRSNNVWPGEAATQVK